MIRLIDRAYAGERVKSAAYLGLVGLCALVAYRRENEQAWVDDNSGNNTLRPATTGECAASAIVHGTILADELTKALADAWKGGA